MLVALLVILAAAPETESRLFIASGAKTEKDAQKLLTTLKVPPSLVLRTGFPKLVESAKVQGLNAGFWLVVLGACDDTNGVQRTHNAGLAALVGRALKGAYAKPVAKQPAGSCPIWIEGGVAGAKPEVAALAKSPDELAVLRKAAQVQHEDGEMLGADITLRRALALGDDSGPTLERYRTVEFVLEDVPFKLPSE